MQATGCPEADAFIRPQFRCGLGNLNMNRWNSLIIRKGAMKLYWRSVLRGCGIGLLLVVATATASAAAEDESGFVLLTGQDGREHWLGYGRDNAKDTWPKNWEFVDGVLHAKGGGADLKTREQYGDFDLRFEWKIAPKGNSGVMYRVSQEKDPAYFTGPEYQVIDDVGNEDAGKSGHFIRVDLCACTRRRNATPSRRANGTKRGLS